MAGAVGSRMTGATLLALLGVVASAGAQASVPDSSAFFKGMELESAGKYREALPYYRASLHTGNAVNAFQGLERVMDGLGWLDSLLAPIDTMIAADPKEPVYRVSQLRAFQLLGRSAELRRSFDQWVAAAPKDPTPYREYARLLLELNQRGAADSVVAQARQRLGSINGLEVQEAQLRASAGDWTESASAWRLALVGSPQFDDAAAYALNPTPADKRDEIRQIFLAPPIDLGARRALAALESMWGSMSAGWDALRDLPVDSTSLDAWTDFGDRAASEERWALARDAYVAALKVQPNADIAMRAATASLNAGDPAAVLRLIPLSQAGTDSVRMAKSYVPLYGRALSLMGRPEDAERLVAAFDRWLAPAPREALTRAIALGWIRRGDVARARAALAAAGPEADSSDTAGWLALYEGDLRTARAMLRGGSESTPELALALATIARIKGDRSPEVGQAFLALARADTAAAALRFAEAADRYPDGASLLLGVSAQLHAVRGESAQAILIWKRIVETMSDTPEAAEADLQWARTLRSQRDTAGASARFEHMIITYPGSSLVPQARRELEQLRGGIRPSATFLMRDSL